MLSCKEISKLVSRSMDEQLGWRERVGVWLHLAMCRLCARFAKQLKELRAKLTEMPEPSESTKAAQSMRLSEEARTRIKEALRQS